MRTHFRGEFILVMFMIYIQTCFQWAVVPEVRSSPFILVLAC